MIVVVGAAVSIVHEWTAAGPVLPAPSVAFTSKLCAPSTSPEYPLGLVQVLKAPPSSRHSKLVPVSLVKEKLALVELEGSGGAEVIVVVGVSVSIVHS